MAIPSGTRIGRYEVLSLLGVGGIGEVYLVKDVQLGRRTAFKILRSDLMQDVDILNRFLQEARATSTVDHPNIITIYETGCQDSIHFIAMEYIDGFTLRQHLTNKPVKIIEALNIAIQVANALAAAHEAGIIHRDIKPHNIMLRPDGFVKVLDFGLAKLTRWPLEIDKDDPTVPLVHTTPGVILGTPNYMSPEQIRGLSIDGRTDIWSLGCVIYEMVAGRVPFEGASPNDAIIQILEHEPQPLARYAREVPDALEWIVAKALTRNLDERYQTAKDISADLKRLMRRLEIDAEMKGSTLPPANVDKDISSPGGKGKPVEEGSSQDTVPIPTEDQPAHLPLRSKEATARTKRYKQLLLLGGIALVIAIGAMVLSKSSFFRPSMPGEEEKLSPIVKSVRLIAESGASQASISPDGNYVVYVAPSRYSRGYCLWSLQISQGTSRDITQAVENISPYGVSFSPDGDIVYYIGADQKTKLHTLYQVPSNGGREPKKILDDVHTPISVSPDGKQFAFVRWYASREEAALMIADIDHNSEPRRLATRQGGEIFSPGLSWSPDGKKIACAIGTSRIGMAAKLVEIAIEDGTEKPLSSQIWATPIQRLCWLKDGTGLILTGTEREAGPVQIWYVSYPQGKATNITNNLVEYSAYTLGISSNSLNLLAEYIESSITIGVVGLNKDEKDVRWVSTDKFDGCGGMSWTSDGRITYGAKRGDNFDIWIMNEDGSENKPLTFDAYSDFDPQVSYDDRYVIFTSNRGGGISNIWRMDIDGRNLKQLTTVEGYSPTCSPDARWVVYVSRQDGKQNLWKVSIEGGVPQKISDKTLSYPKFSPRDNNLIACLFSDQDSNLIGQPVIVSIDNGQIIKQIAFPDTAVGPPGWMPDGQSVFYLDSGPTSDSIYSQKIDNNKRVQLTKFTSKRISCFELSRAGKIVLSGTAGTSNLILIKDFKKP